MTSVSYRQDSAPAQAERSGHPEIVHFDATVRRKEKMRHLAGQERTETVNDVAPAERRATPAAKPAAAPAPVPPVAARPAAPPRPAAAPPVRPASAPAEPKAPSVSSAPAPAPARAAVAAPVSAPAPAASQPAPAAKPLNVDLAELEKVLINFVVEQTGYPPEMVELDADLEADLGIDSIKKAQMLGELAEQLDVQITISEDMSLDDFPTLRHITDFLRKSAEGSAVSGAGSAAAAVPSSPVAAAPAPAAPARAAADVNGHPSVSRSAASAAPSMPAAPAPAPAPAAASGVAALDKAGLEQFLVNFVVEQTGYPPEMVELDADLEADLGIDSIKKAQLFGELAEQLNIQITITEDMSLDQFPTLRHVLDALSSGSPGGAAAAAAPTVAETVAVAAPVARPTAAAAAPAAAAVADAAASSSGKVAVASLNPAELEAFLVNFVVEQTGYPPEMVELDADLEADLGIDSIKKAQLFGELAENLDVQIQITEDMSLDNYRSLRDVLNLLLQNQA